MKRTKIAKQPSAILTADWHLRSDTPICRMDDFWKAQWAKVGFIADLCTKYGVEVIHAGDLFNHWKPSPYLLTYASLLLPPAFSTIYGNHDLPQHLMELREKTGTHNLEQNNRLRVLEKGHWLESVGNIYPASNTDVATIGIWHGMVWHGKRPWPGCEDPSAEQILEENPQFPLILTGHNHQTFVAEQDGRLLVNPGSLTRQKADQEKHQPCVFLWYADDNTVEKILLPAQPGVISREHIEKREEKDERIAAFIAKLNQDGPGGLSFEENLEQVQRETKARSSVMQIIRRALENGETGRQAA